MKSLNSPDKCCKASGQQHPDANQSLTRKRRMSGQRPSLARFEVAHFAFSAPKGRCYASLGQRPRLPVSANLKP